MAEQIFPEQRFSIITLGVRDKAAMTRFYEDMIGFRNVGPEEMAMFDLGGVVLGLWEADKLARDAGQQGGRPDGFNGIALAYNARSEAEVDEIFGRCEAAGVTVTQPPHKAFWGGYSGYFADPEGNAWEVAFNPFWTFDSAGRVVLPQETA